MTPGALRRRPVLVGSPSTRRAVRERLESLLGLVPGQLGGIDRFLGWAYSYHYLNWFSKTSIIKWHQVEKKRFVFSGVLWVVSLALYKVDYRLGFAAISVLSRFTIVGATPGGAASPSHDVTE